MQTDMLSLLLLLPLLASRCACQSLPSICSTSFGITLPEDYDPSEAPFPPAAADRNKSVPIVVTSHNFINEITEIDDLSRTLKMPIVSLKSWIDHRIKA